MRDFLGFLKPRIGLFAAFCLSQAIFILVLRLAGFDAETVYYGALLAFLIVLAAALFSLRSSMKRLKDLRHAGKAAYDINLFPEPNDPLEKGYLDIVRALGEKTIKQAHELRLAREYNEEYLTRWAHQIKTPIAAMRLNLENAEDTETSRAVSIELFRIEQYVDMMLWHFRLDEANDLVIRRFSLEGLVRESVKKYAPLFVRRRLRLSVEGKDAMALSDEKWISFVVEQILDNAIKYTDHGGVTISIHPGPVLEIRDTGIGIAKSDLPRIFESGYTGENGRLNRRSSGLGLSLCKKACDRLGHRLWAESEPGAGSSFFLDLRTNHFEIE